MATDVPQRDRPPIPGSLALNSEVIVTMPNGSEKRGKIRAVTAGTAFPGDGNDPRVLVEFRRGMAGILRLWVPREMVRPVPLPWIVRARRWVSSFLFGEE